MTDRDNPQVESQQTEHERRVAQMEETGRGESDVDPVAGSDRRPTAEEDLAADRDEDLTASGSRSASRSRLSKQKGKSKSKKKD